MHAEYYTRRQLIQYNKINASVISYHAKGFNQISFDGNQLMYAYLEQNSKKYSFH